MLPMLRVDAIAVGECFSPAARAAHLFGARSCYFDAARRVGTAAPAPVAPPCRGAGRC